MAGRRTSLCYCQSKARQRHIAISNTIVSCLPQRKHRVYSQTLRALAVAINNQGTVNNPQLSQSSAPHASTWCYSLTWKGLKFQVDSQKIRTFYTWISAAALGLQSSTHEWTEPSTDSVHLHHHSGGVTKNQHLLCTIPVTSYYRVTPRQPGTPVSHLSKRAHWESKIL